MYTLAEYAARGGGENPVNALLLGSRGWLSRLLRPTRGAIIPLDTDAGLLGSLPRLAVLTLRVFGPEQSVTSKGFERAYGVA